MSPVSPKPCSMTTAGPAPPIRTCRLVPLVSTIWVRKPDGKGWTSAEAGEAIANKPRPNTRKRSILNSPSVSFTAPNALYYSFEQYSFDGLSSVDGECLTELSGKANNAEARSRRHLRCGRRGALDQRGRPPHGAFEIRRERALGRARTRSWRHPSA